MFHLILLHMLYNIKCWLITTSISVILQPLFKCSIISVVVKNVFSWNMNWILDCLCIYKGNVKVFVVYTCKRILGSLIRM